MMLKKSRVRRMPKLLRENMVRKVTMVTMTPSLKMMRGMATFRPFAAPIHLPMKRKTDYVQVFGKLIEVHLN